MIKVNLKIIYGKAGTGKSQYCLKEIAELIKQKQRQEHKTRENIIIITPEQFSFTTEKKLMETIETRAVLNAEVVTFKRMAYRVINEIGAKQKVGLTKCGRAMLIYNILEKQKNNLKLLGKTKENVEIAITAINEFKQHGITNEQLEVEMQNTEEQYLKTKLQDMNLIYKSFEEQIKDKYIDETDLLTILAENIEKTEMFRDTIFYIDEFSGFTAQEYEIIKKLIKIGKQVNITICTDSLFTSTDPENDIFYSNKQTVAKLYKLANELEIKVEEELLEKTKRFKNNELKILSENLYKNQSTKYEEDVENIHLFLAKNQYSEIEKVAKEITKLVRDKKYKYKEISIITKNIEAYSSLVRAIFSEYDIPVFIDEKRELSQNIFIQYVLAILDIFAKNWSYESIFNYIKTGFLDIDRDDIYKLENYCIKWGIKQSKWKKDFTTFGEEKQKEEIARLNEIRKEIVEPLLKLKENIDEEKTAENVTRNLYNFLQEQKIEEKLRQKVNYLEEQGMIDLANEYANSYQVLINVLDEIVLVFGKDKMTLDSKYAQILKTGLQNSGLGKIPGTQDQVILGDVDRSRSHKARAVFIIGINDGIFPSVNKDEGFFNDDDRENLKENGIELAKGTLERLYEDNFNIYKAFTTAEEELYLSYTSSDTEGKAQRPSVLIYKIKKLFPKIYEQSNVVKEEYEITNEKNTYEELLQNIARKNNGEEIEGIWETVYKYYKEHENWKEKLQNDLKGLEYTNVPNKLDEKIVKKLYGNILNTSISKLEQYRRCPFSYYLQYELKLKEKEELKVQSFDTGSFMHETIDEFFKKVNEENIALTEFLENDSKIQELIDPIIEENLNYGKQYMFKATVKYKILVKRLKRIIATALKYIIEGLVYSDFKIQGTEIEFGVGEEYKPIIIELEDGRKIELTGKIDRMDIAQDEDGKYLRIIDYKSSAKTIDLNEVYAGLQIQLLSYMDAVCKEDMIPAGALYFGLLEQIVQSDQKISEEEIEEQIRKKFKMKGLILADVKVIKMQDKNLTSGASKIIPAGITSKGGIDKRYTNGVNQDEFKILQQYIYKTIKEISKEILSGNIDLKPYNNKGKTPCEYCSYKSICGFDAKNRDNTYNYIKHKTNDEVVRKMSEKCKQ